ncbi:unnamed protein product [Blepharisma stoltei]|uniref:Uncharacterized protein n=1 Tax=Blepharisma stoltei TaxID=1481888 RepID=A0AAU9J099_9CILI|nr:unnamed protein product [Blepharisma stoltei]
MSNRVLTIKALFSDNSLQKEKRKKERYEKAIKELEANKKLLEEKEQIRREKWERFRAKEAMKKQIREYLRMHNEKNAKLHNYAKTIQNWYRNVKISQKHEEVKLENLRFSVCENIENLQSTSKYIFWNFGPGLEKSVIKIQQAYKRHKLIRKINETVKALNLIKKRKKKDAKKIIQKGIVVLANRIKVKNEKWRIFKEKELKRIQRNLALLKISQYWKKLNLSGKIIVRRYQKYYRKLFAQGTIQRLAGRYVIGVPETTTNQRRNSSCSIASSHSTPFRHLTHTPASSGHEPEPIQNNLMDDILAQNMIIAERRKRIRKGKISYAIKPLRLKPIEPVLMTDEEDDDIFTKSFEISKNQIKPVDASSRTSRNQTLNISFTNLSGISTQNSIVFNKSRESTAEGRKRILKDHILLKPSINQRFLKKLA